jgi:Tol biopolymer transport system component
LHELRSPPIRHDAGGLAWSPDGKQIAFSDFDGIYVIKADGSGRRPVVRSHVIRGDGPSWSPNGKEIAFSDYYAGVIRVVRGDGTFDRVIYRGTQISRPAWSPDGRSIAFDWDPANGGASLIGVFMRSCEAGSNRGATSQRRTDQGSTRCGDR